ncbi:P pilus assembly/Cpx signaling pathway, periplasmic inhibitor/zinc-resistance associated protein [Trichocoleus sp. FACHB-90]|uniref:Spy/CpxP family protein refolding chaperone n=1 Tax=Cyanophyceae TaxID=3028117 RepID=UPI00168563B2|nr:P pilus assembly/Cpx signaling pathway, periplasmic inhibitor/zinc-resistance associated protein [Trichocoleus sp. FACHB-90]MBD1929548.1 P pilus assembly/Cpx signaling pathway, periplasmic inhibitor/zinc-resistance associated protein [Trichocoleus sp. FACHB-90]
MKLKLISMLAGAVVFFVPFTSSAAFAQTNSPSAPASSGLMGIELTPQQKTKIEQIRSNTRSQIENILTAEQKNKFKAAVGEGQDMRRAFAAMNLSDQQKTQLQGIFQSAASQFSATLTQEQRQKIMENMRSRQQPQQNPK